jgi:sugar phosphate isomerase/epimerase
VNLGATGPLSRAGDLKKAGFNFIEVAVRDALVPEDPEEAFVRLLPAIIESPCRVFSANCFIPAELKTTGPEVNFDRIGTYLEKVFNRAARAGIRTIVFGSGGSRNVPEGFDRPSAMGQLLETGRLLGSIAAPHNITVAVEPLCDSNILTTVRECAEYVGKVDNPSVRLLVDAFHWSRNDNDTGSIVEYASMLAHVHIATYTSRKGPGVEPCDFGPFFGALARGGYAGPIVVEAAWKEYAQETVIAFRALKELTERFGVFVLRG